MDQAIILDLDQALDRALDKTLDKTADQISHCRGMEWICLADSMMECNRILDLNHPIIVDLIKVIMTRIYQLKKSKMRVQRILLKWSMQIMYSSNSLIIP
jgi:hypothetical protein